MQAGRSWTLHHERGLPAGYLLRPHRRNLPGCYRHLLAAVRTIASVAVPAFIDAQAPTVTVFVPAASDSVGGWFPRTSGNLEVRATVDDGSGSGAQSATLSFDACPASGACTFAGTLLPQASGAPVYSFNVPRSVQAAGSEAPLAVTVKAQDVA